MKAFYHDTFTFPLPEKHRFPIEKYTLLREAVLSARIISEKDMLIPEPASDDQLGLVHSIKYLEKITSGNITAMECRKMGFPWSPELVERARRSVGSTIAACRIALEEGFAVNLAGGTHHAFRDRAEGYCVFNDSAVAAKVMQTERLVKRVIIIDCDVHQGDGTAKILEHDDTIFTFSIHAAKNYPFKKEKSDLDIPLNDGVTDQEYLLALEDGLEIAINAAQPDLAIYIAGADPFAGDRLGRLALTKQGLTQRDQLILSWLSSANLPTAVVMGGGYAPNIQDIIDIHMQTIKLAATIKNAVKFL